MRRPQYTLTRTHMHDHARYLLQTHVGLHDYRRRCSLELLLAVLFTACATISSLAAACRRLLAAPCDETVRQALFALLPAYAELQRRLNRALQADLPVALRRRRQPLAIDIHLIPYHGRYQDRPQEVYRGRPRDGTSHFHAYATAYVIRKGRRYSVALTGVQAGDAWQDVIRRLLQAAAKAGVRPRLLLLDRGFFTVNVVRYLQAARVPFVIPLVAAALPLATLPTEQKLPGAGRSLRGTRRRCPASSRPAPAPAGAPTRARSGPASPGRPHAIARAASVRPAVAAVDRTSSSVLPRLSWMNVPALIPVGSPPGMLPFRKLLFNDGRVAGSLRMR